VKDKELKLISQNLENLISSKRITEIAKETDFIQRASSKITEENFFNLNIFSQENVCQNSLEDLSTFLSRTENIEITAQSLNERYNKKAVNFLKQVFQEMMLNSTTNSFTINSKLTNQFNRIRLTDSSNIELPENCKNTYKGFGGSAKESAARLQLTYDIKSGGIVLNDISDVTNSDTKYLSVLEKEIERNDLEIKDLGYFSINHFQTIEESNAYYLSRLKSNVTVYILNPKPKKFATGKIKKNTEYIKIDLVEKCKELNPNEIIELEVFIGEKKLKTRLILCKLPEEAVLKKLEHQKKTAHKKQTKISEKTKNLSTVNMYITNIPGDMIPKEAIFSIYSLRWQIELFFKSLKSTLEIDKVKKVKLERIQCHLYGTLIKMILISQIMFNFREQIYKENSTEISEYKSFKIIYTYFKEVKNALFDKSLSLLNILKKIKHAIIKNGMKSKKKNQKTTIEIFNQ